MGEGGSCSPRGSVVMTQSIAGFSPFNENLNNFIRCLGNDRRFKWSFKNCNDLQRRMLRPKPRGRNRDGSVVYCYLLARRWYPSAWARHGATPRGLIPAPNTLPSSSDRQIAGQWADFPAVLLAGSLGSRLLTGLKATSLPSPAVGCNWPSSLASNTEIPYGEFFAASCCSLGIRAPRTT